MIDIQRVMKIMQKNVLGLWQPHKNRLYTHLSEEIYAHYENSILYAEGRWVSRLKDLFRLRTFFLHSLIFLRTEVIATRIKDSRCLFYLPFLTYLTAKLNELNTELHGEKRKTIVFIIGTIGPFTETPNLLQTRLTHVGSLHFQTVKSC